MRIGVHQVGLVDTKMDRRSMVVPGEPVRVTSNGRRYFSKAHKEAVIAKCLMPGASLAAIALANGFNANLVRKWVRDSQARQVTTKTHTKLLPVALDPVEMHALSGGAGRSTAGGAIEIRMGRIQLLVHGLVDQEQLSVVLNTVLRSR